MEKKRTSTDENQAGSKRAGVDEASGGGNVTLHIRACCVYGYVTYTGMLHIRACYIYGLGTRNVMLHIRVSIQFNSI